MVRFKSFTIALLFALMTLVVLPLKAEETLVYPFDSIRIVEALRFQVSIPEQLQEDSFLKDVSGSTLTIYVGKLQFMKDDLEVSGSSNILVITNEANEDVARWLINGYSRLSDTEEVFVFASHIQIDPSIGVVKDFTNGSLPASVVLKEGVYSFLDNKGVEFVMVPDTFEVETNLDILISAYEGA